MASFLLPEGNSQFDALDNLRKFHLLPVSREVRRVTGENS
jgi:hypothetical protein